MKLQFLKFLTQVVGLARDLVRLATLKQLASVVVVITAVVFAPGSHIALPPLHGTQVSPAWHDALVGGVTEDDLSFCPAVPSVLAQQESPAATIRRLMVPIPNGR